MPTEADFLASFQVHSPGQFEKCLDAGMSPLRLIDCLIEGYLCSTRFADCVRIMLAAGADIGVRYCR